MIAVRPAAARGCSDMPRVRTLHSFSCAGYYDPAHMGFGPLRAINEIALEAGASIAAEPRANIDVLTWVIDGGVTCGAREQVLAPGELDVFSAGHGALDGLANASKELPARVVQIWIQPERLNATPRSGACRPDAGSGLHALPAGEGGSAAASLRGDMRASLLRWHGGDRLAQTLCLGRRAWLQMVRGSVRVNGALLSAGDGAATMHEVRLEFRAVEDGELLFFELPAY